MRDQLLKAGLVDKKKVRQTNLELKKDRRDKQASRESKRDIERREAEAQAALQAERAEKLRLERAREVERREADARRRAVHTWLRTHRVPMRQGNQLFFHLAANRRQVVRCMLPESLVVELRRGRLAIAWDGLTRRDPEYVILPDLTAARVAELAPERILFWNREPPPDDDPAEQPYDMGELLDARKRVPDRWVGLR